MGIKRGPTNTSQIGIMCKLIQKIFPSFSQRHPPLCVLKSNFLTHLQRVLYKSTNINMFINNEPCLIRSLSECIYQKRPLIHCFNRILELHLQGKITFMRAVIQRVNHAKLVIDDLLYSEIGHGLLVLLGIHETDGENVRFRSGCLY